MERKGQSLRLEMFRGCFGENTMEVWRPGRKKMKDEDMLREWCSGGDKSLKGIGVEKNANLEDLGVMK